MSVENLIKVYSSVVGALRQIAVPLRMLLGAVALALDTFAPDSWRAKKEWVFRFERAEEGVQRFIDFENERHGGGV